MTLVAMIAVAESATGANTGFASASAYGTATAAPAVDDSRYSRDTVSSCDKAVQQV